MNVLSFFSGAMGLDIGLEKAGFNTIAACEVDINAIKTIKKNKKGLNVYTDINNISNSELDSIKHKNKIDLIAGGPPCQAFSTAGKRKGFEDDRGNIFLRYLEIIEYLKPSYFVIENVRGLLSTKFELNLDEFLKYDIDERLYKKPGTALYYVVKRLEESGYNINFNLYNSKYFGTPQSRERVIVIGTLSKEKVPFLIPTHSDDDVKLEKVTTVRDALKGLKEKDEFNGKFSPKTLKYVSMLKSGENWRNLPDNIQAEAMGKSFKLGGGKTGFYRRLDWNKPSPTLVTSPTMPATLLCHPEKNRPLSTKEYARIQQFPDNWKFEGNLTSIYKQIGNAVPVGVGEAIGKVIMNHNKGYKDELNKNFKYSRYHNTSFESFIISLHREFEQLKLI